MSLTINEMEINTTVTENAKSQDKAGGGGGGGGMSKQDKELLIQECLDRVKELLEDLKER